MLRIEPVDEYKLNGFRAYDPDIVAVFSSLTGIQQLTVGVELLLFFASGDVPFSLPSDLCELKVLELPNFILCLLSEARVLFCLIMSSPNLHKLTTIGISNDSSLPQAEVIDSLQLLLEAEDHPTASCFQCLEQFDMTGCLGTQVELHLVRLVLTSAPRLRRVFLKLNDKMDSGKSFKFLTEVTGCKRASAEAEVICVRNEKADAP